jgi:hypothetical protein
MNELAPVTHQSASPTWLKRVSAHRIRLADIHLYVFNEKYQQQNQRRGSAGAFEISFVSTEGQQTELQSVLKPSGKILADENIAASRRFKELFQPPIAITNDETPSSPSGCS